MRKPARGTAREAARPRGAVRAWLVLAAALASSLVLVVAAFVSYGDPSLAGQATLARLAGSVADGVVDEWERLRRDEAPFADGTAFRFAAELPPAPRAALDLPLEPNPVLDALLAEANRLDRAEHAPEKALEVLGSARERSADPARRGEILLRTVQLAAPLAEHAAEARAAWQTAWDELDPGLARHGTSTLLLVTLAAGPVLELETRATARERLARAWARGELALPAEALLTEPTSGALLEPLPLRAELRRRLQALVSEAAPDAELERTLLGERTALLAEHFGALEPASDGALRLALTKDAELLHRRDAKGLQGVLLAPGTTQARLSAALAANELVPEGFALDFTGTEESLGALVRAATPLAGSPLAFALRHADPTRIQDTVARRQGWTRAALLVLALFTAAAGLSTFRALRRERRLAALRTAFVASVSHELRTPIASILLLSENLERERAGPPEAQKRYHGLIRREAERLRVLVDDVLDVARLERGERIAARLGSVPAAELATALEDAARARVVEAGGTLEFRASGLPSEVRADAEALRRAVLNLVENALRHSGSTDLDLALAGDGVGGLVIRVRDHGRGVPLAARERIFEPFARLEDALARPGAGLGLAIVREVAERHGGRALAGSPEEGPGAVFEIHLPRAPLEADSGEPA